jgi:C-terminal processing protease CtpA/Prc
MNRRAWIRWRRVASPWIVRALVSCSLTVGLAASAAAQSIAVDRQRGLQMLDQVREDLVQDYWDPHFGGVDLDALIERARQRINAAQSLGEIFGLVAGVCLDLRDSHTTFYPPARVQEVEYGWSWQYVGDRALVNRVDDGSDARAKGLRVGDAVVEVSGFTLTRATHQTIAYLLHELRPQPQLVVTVERGGARRTLTLASKIRKQRRRLDVDNELDRNVIRLRSAFAEAAIPKPKRAWLAPGVLYWRMSYFFPDLLQLESQIDKLDEAQRLVLDLRGNPGGRMQVLGIVAGLFAPEGTPILAMTGRDGTAKIVTGNKAKPFSGPIVVLVDSESGSCAEMLAYFLQQRGAKVIGDATDGRVRGSQMKSHAAGDGEYKVLYALQVTMFDIAMADGTHLEGRGLRPDIVSLPTADDLEQGLDPVLARAAASVGVTIDPERAARLSRQ